MHKDEIVAFVKKQLYEWAFEDIKRASQGGSKMGSFILGSCLIDYLACFYFNKDATRETYKKFCKIYLTKYDAEDLYHSLRCKLVHNYTEGGKYAFIDKRSDLHMYKQSNSQIVLNLENFMEDIKNSMDVYFSEVDINKVLKEKLVKRYKKVGILGKKEIG